MTTRDIGSGHHVQPTTPDVLHIDGRIYYQRIACDGWPTGPCPSPAVAHDRVTAYERCEEVSEAAPNQGSRAQLTAFVQVMERPTSPRDIGVYSSRGRDLLTMARNAIGSGLHSPAWLAISAELLRMANDRALPSEVINAGGAMIRRRLPNTQIPSRSM